MKKRKIADAAEDLPEEMVASIIAQIDNPNNANGPDVSSFTS